MSIPGLGRETQPAAPISTNRTLTLNPFWEWRFEVGFNSEIKVKLISGTAEKDGTELASQQAYRFSGVKSKILTLQGCKIQVDGIPHDEFVAEVYQPTDSPMNSYLNLHFKLTAMRETAAAGGTDGPRVLICGSHNTGKTSVARTLASYATRVGFQPLVVNADPKEGMLALPGTLSASVLASVLDIEAVDGWGTTPTSGPNQVPVKLPLVFFYGRASPTEAPDQYRELVTRLAGTATSRFSHDSSVRSSGIIVDTPAVDEKSRAETDLLVHIAEEFSVNIVIVLGSSRLTAELSKRLSHEETGPGEKTHVILLDKSDGVAERDEAFREQTCEALIKEYFFGSVGRTLSPATQQVDFDSLTIYRLGDSSIYGTRDDGIMVAEPSPLMTHSTLAIAHASTKDSPETIRTANLMGFVYVADVDKERRKMKILAPVAGRLGDRPFLWGSWPEPFVNLLG
ncbi:Clp1 protein [Sodiomyces alkalinus F11]|uniref:Polynucleotide 5'-hydroxyl-kinase GRC3 n=1 Tax=Sodiomyces alkalinus (strain CBS 110278 / VKM F-3762 / F11) TaxID=1314773 RepID=A0A3N2Q6D9_SODAK|nr:Clp1 protein [Sodiomyces alkalinus F11]ROT42185.1 Clp1 protein [Sodiomyces alkalinus F11]